MPKNTFQDIVTKPKKSGGIKAESSPKTLSEGRKIAKKKAEEVSRIFRKTEYPTFVASSNNKNSGRFAIWALAAASIVFLIFALSSLFGGAVVTITPKSESFSLKGANFQATLNKPDGDLPFQIMTLNDVETKNINSSRSETVNKKASGRVVIYNNYSKESQPLVINTRLEDPVGHIFRIDKAVTVPGISVQNKINVPGSIEVDVQADKIGTEYNVGLVDFTIPGFKGSPKYEKFYARSKTQIGGAISGTVFVASQEEIDKIKTDSAVILNDKLNKKAKAELPKGYALLQGATYFEITNNDATFESKTALVPISVEGKLLAVILDENKLASKIAESSLKDFDKNQKVNIPHIDSLIFSLKSDRASLKDIKEIAFNLTNDGRIIWQIDETKFANELKSKNKNEFKDILAHYPNIARAEVKFSPFWRSKFPKDIRDIKIINTLAPK